MITARTLEERLQREMPALIWHCQPSGQSQVSLEGEIPEHLEVQAEKDGVHVAGGPWKLSGNMLLRWGVDATAKLLCEEYLRALNTPKYGSARRDKLSEL